MNKRRNIVLIGMMGAGKSSIGHLLDAKLQDFHYIDIDNEIERNEKMTIEEIFAVVGEAHFRELEHNTIKKFSNYHNQVIATGGGAVENQENLELLRQNSVIFYLKASIDELYERVKMASNRPLLKTTNPKQKLKDLMEKREQFYIKADFEINTENKELIEIVNEILEKYETIN